jgi:predicted amidohydrolase
MIFIPANFTFNTGKYHWLTLLKARAIENQIFIAAVNQHGYDKDSGVRSYGCSVLIDPWGNIINKSRNSNYIMNCSADFSLLKKYSQMLPVLSNFNRNFK